MLGQDPGAGADEGGDAVFCFAIFHYLRTDEGKRTRDGKLREHRIVGFLHLHDEGIGIGCFGRDKKPHHLKPGVAFFIVDERIEICLHRVSIELFAVTERDTGTDFERIGAAIGRYCPTFCDCRMV